MYSINSSGSIKDLSAQSLAPMYVAVSNSKVCGAISHFLAIHMLNVFRYASIFGMDFSTFSLSLSLSLAS